MGNHASSTSNTVPRLSAADLKQALDSFDVVLFDCDGTLWRGCEIIAGAASAANRLAQLGKRVGYVTNGSLATKACTVAGIRARGFPLSDDNLVATNNHAVAVYLREVGCRRVFTVGNAGLDAELDAAGIAHFTTSATKTDADADHDRPVDAVVVSLDEDFNYRRLSMACHQLSTQPKALFVATNIDGSYPSDGRVVPGVGALVAAVETATGRKPDVVIGKPQRFMFDQLQQAAAGGVDAARTVMVGDRCDADVAFAAEIGAASLLVLTGISDLDEANRHAALAGDDAHQRRMTPSCYLPSIGDLDDMLGELIAEQQR